MIIMMILEGCRRVAKEVLGLGRRPRTLIIVMMMMMTRAVKMIMR